MQVTASHENVEASCGFSRHRETTVTHSCLPLKKNHSDLVLTGPSAHHCLQYFKFPVSL